MKSKDEEILKKLSNSDNWFVRSNVAANYNCTQIIFEKLSQDCHWKVRFAVARNTNCISILEKLVNDSDKNVRLEVCNNKNVTQHIIDKIYNSKETERLFNHSKLDDVYTIRNAPLLFWKKHIIILTAE